MCVVSYRKVIWNICPKLTCWVLLLYPCSISPNSVSLKWTSCLGHLGPSQLSDCKRQERPSSASLYSCTHLKGTEKPSIQCKHFHVCEPLTIKVRGCMVRELAGRIGSSNIGIVSMVKVSTKPKRSGWLTQYEPKQIYLLWSQVSKRSLWSLSTILSSHCSQENLLFRFRN